MHFDSLDENNHLMFAIKHYDNPQSVTVDDFMEDMKKFKYLKRLLKRYSKTHVLRVNLILNHLIILFNVFGEGTIPLLMYKLEEEYWSVIKTFLILSGPLSRDRRMSFSCRCRSKRCRHFGRVMNEDAPTMSVGNGGMTGSADATGPNAGYDPLLTGRKKPKKRRRYAMVTKDMLATEGVSQRDSAYLPFLISYDGAEQYVLYSKSEAALKIELRKIYRPENFKKLAVKRLYPNDVIKFYWKKRQQALGQE